MTLAIFPSSPLWADLTRSPLWAEEVQNYDSGLRQAATAWVRPLYVYGVNVANMNETKQAALNSFWNQQQGKTTPFLIKDPYDYTATNVTQPTSTDMGVGSGFFFMDANSYRVIPDSSGLRVDASDSSNLTNGIDFVLSQDNGWCSLLKAVGSVWTSSFEFFRKAGFDSQYTELSPVWNIFSTSLVIRELLPST